jgi:RimJ/RimL family protein N-acetyltransferase
VNLVFGADQFIAHWVAQRVREFNPMHEKYTCIGVADDVRLIAGMVYHQYRGHDLVMTFASDSPKWANKGNLGAFFRYPFGQLGCKRVTTFAARKNKRSRKLIEGVGFKLEGVMRKGNGDQDAMIYGMLAEECKWIERKTDGIVSKKRDRVSGFGDGFSRGQGLVAGTAGA